MREEETKYTKGEWEANGTMIDCMVEGTRVTIASVNSCWHGNGNETSNAQLIASAPNLLQALQLIMRDLPTRRDWLDPVIEQMAREALKKAEKDIEP